MRRDAPRCNARYIPSANFGRVVPRTAPSVAFAHALRSQMSRKFSAPLTEGGLADVQPHALLADRFNDHVHVRMRLVRMQDHGIAMLRTEGLPGKGSSGTK